MTELFYIIPIDAPLTEGTLVTDKGEEVEGVWMQQVWPDKDGPLEAVQIQFTLMVRALPPLDPDDVKSAIEGLIKVHESTGSEFETKEDHLESNEIRN